MGTEAKDPHSYRQSDPRDIDHNFWRIVRRDLIDGDQLKEPVGKMFELSSSDKANGHKLSISGLDSPEDACSRSGEKCGGVLAVTRRFLNTANRAFADALAIYDLAWDSESDPKISHDPVPDYQEHYCIECFHLCHVQGEGGRYARSVWRDALASEAMKNGGWSYRRG